jgi:hypothetical protein
MTIMPKTNTRGRKSRSGKVASATTDRADAVVEVQPRANTTKIDVLVELLRQPAGATIVAMTAATGWQAHSVRGALSGAIKKKLGLAVTSANSDAGRIYRVASEDGGAA